MTAHDFAMALRSTYLAMHRRTDLAVASSGITADQFVVIAALAEGDASLQRELVPRTSSDPNTLRAMLVLLENRGLVSRPPHPTDGRARSVSLTRKGRSVFQRAWRRSEVVRSEIRGTLMPGELDSLVSILRRLAAALEHDSSGSLKPRNQRIDATP